MKVSKLGQMSFLKLKLLTHEKVVKYLRFTSPAHTSMAVPYRYTHNVITHTFMGKSVQGMK